MNNLIKIVTITCTILVLLAMALYIIHGVDIKLMSPYELSIFLTEHIWTILTAIGTISAAWAAYHAANVSLNIAWKMENKEKQKNILKLGITLLEQAYDCLKSNAQRLEVQSTNMDDYLPQKSLSQWEMAARLILLYKEIKKEIINDDILKECNEYESFWRLQFLNLLISIEEQTEFHIRNTLWGLRTNINLVDAIIIHHFASQMDEKIYLIDRDDLQSARNKFGIDKRWKGLINAIERQNNSKIYEKK